MMKRLIKTFSLILSFILVFCSVPPVILSAANNDITEIVEPNAKAIIQDYDQWVADPKGVSLRLPETVKAVTTGGNAYDVAVDWDAGDILMVLILIFLSLESDDDEILVLLGLALVLGF